MTLSKSVSCYRSHHGKNGQVTEDITGGAKTVQFRVVPPPECTPDKLHQKPKVAFHIVREGVFMT